MSVREFVMELEVGKELFYGEDSMFGIYSMKPVNYQREVKTNSWGSISLQGTTRRLKEGEQYEVRFEGGYSHPKYGEYFKIVEIAPERLNTVSEQDNFLRAIIADNHFLSLKNAYPDTLLVDAILEDKINTNKTKGIKAKTLAKIKTTVQNNAGISVLISRLNELELSTSKIERILKHFGSPDKAVQAIEESIYNLCELKNFGFLTVDSVALKRGDNPTNENRIYACIDHLLKTDNQEGDTWSDKEKVLTEAITMLNIDKELVVDAVEAMSGFEEYYTSDTRLAFSRVRDKEIAIYKHLKRIENSYIRPHITDIDDRIDRAELKQGFKFTDEQRHTIVECLKGNGVSIINGVAGSGKSFVVKSIVNILQEDNYMSACLSGKAANILMKNGIQSSTIHRMLKWEPASNGFMYGLENKLPYKLLMLDEMSMNNINLTLSVLEAVKDGTMLLLVGDSGQLPSIGLASGNILRDLLDTKRFPVYEFTKVHRQAEKSGILEIASRIRSGTQLMPYNSSGREIYGELQDQTIISYADKGAIVGDIIKICRAYKPKISRPEDLFDFQVIVANRERGELSVRNLNIRLQEIFNNTDKPSLNRNGYNYLQGDKIISQGNSYGQPVFEDEFKYLDYLDSNQEEDEMENSTREVDIFNGTLGYIYDVNVREKTILVQFEGVQGLVAILQQDMDNIDLAYAATCHKMQGSGIRDVICGLSFDAYKLLSKQMLYTMVTRGSGKGVLLVENNAMFQAINTDVSLSRKTFLADFMRVDVKRD